MAALAAPLAEDVLRLVDSKLARGVRVPRETKLQAGLSGRCSISAARGTLSWDACPNQVIVWCASRRSCTAARVALL